MNKYILAKGLLLLVYFVLIGLLPALGVTNPHTFGLIGWLSGTFMCIISDIENNS